jgi:hypothetical protein
MAIFEGIFKPSVMGSQEVPIKITGLGVVR